MAVKQNNLDDIGTPTGGTGNSSNSATSEVNTKMISHSFVPKKTFDLLSNPKRPEINLNTFNLILTHLSEVEMPMKDDLHKYIQEVNSFYNILYRSGPFDEKYFQLICEKVADCNINIKNAKLLSPAVGILFNLFDETLKQKAIKSIVKHTDPEIIMTIKNFCFWIRTTSFCKDLHLYIISILNELQKVHNYPIIKEIAENIEMERLFAVLGLPLYKLKIEVIITKLAELIGNDADFFNLIKRAYYSPIVKSVTNNKNNFLLRLLTETSGKNAYLGESTRIDNLSYEYQTNERNNIYNVEYHNKNPKVGLVNLGNTCYMNSVLQALAMTKEFSREILLCGNKTPLLRNVQELVALMLHSPRPELTPSAVLNVARPPGFAPGFQQDSSEFLGYLLETLHEHESSTRSPLINVTQLEMLQSFGNKNQDKTFNISSSDDFDMSMDSDEIDKIQNDSGASCSNFSITDNSFKKSKSILNPTFCLGKTTDLPTTIEKTFTGNLVTTYECMTCGWKSKIVDAFRDLQLSFPDKKNDCASNYTVQDLINYYCSREILNGENQYYCAKCKKLCDAVRFMKIINAPKNLILTLKHFKYDQKYNMRAKLLHQVLPDEKLSLSVCSPDGETEPAVVVHYSLYAGVVHSGCSMDSGHYYTYGTDNEDQWYKFNDNIVSISKISDLHNLTPPNTPYILFYQMRSKFTEGSSIKIQLPSTPTLDELPTQLRDYVNSDNISYKDEMRRNQMIMGQSLGYRNSNSGGRNGRGDQDDDDEPPPSSACNEKEFSNRNKYVSF